MNIIEINGKNYQLLITYKSIKNINMRVEGDLIKISCNRLVSKKKIHEFVYSKQAWILKHSKSKTPGFNNDTVYYLGKPYLIKHEFSKENIYLINNNYIYFYTLSYDITLFEKIYYRYGIEKLTSLISNYVIEFYSIINKYSNKPKPLILFKKYKSRWGMYNSRDNSITLNIMLIHFSENAIKAVLWHEFCHMLYLNHGREFHQMIQLYMPYYKEYEKELKL